MNKSWSLIPALVLIVNSLNAQSKAVDSVVIRVGESSKLILSIHDKKDLETLKHYDFQTLMKDMISKIEKKDSTPLSTPSKNYRVDTLSKPAIVTTESSGIKNESSDEEDWEKRSHRRKMQGRRTYHSFNVDLGTNNFLSNGQFPDQSNAQYSVKPWGSWYVALNSILRTHVTGKFFVEWGVGVSWYNFKFQDTKTLVTRDNTNVTFSQDSRPLDFDKSKLTIPYLNASVVPMLDFGRGGRKTTIFDGSRVDFSSRGNHSSAFRIGAGPYVGYRIDSYTKQRYNDNGHEKSEVHDSNFYLNDIRYGVRLQFGFNDVDFFFNYDLNSLFVESKGPKLNAMSFGITF